jgi:hypothetical protein
VEVVWFAGFPSSGSHPIIVFADRNGTIVEADKTNNRADKEVNYAAGALPNLQVESVQAMRGGSGVAQADEGDTVEVRVTVANASPAPFAGATVVEARDGTSLVFSAPVGRMEPGQRLDFAFNWTAQSEVRLRLSVNTLAEVQESDHTDNARDLQLTVNKAAEPLNPVLIGGAAAGAAVAALVLLLLVRRRRAGGATEAEAGAAPGEAGASDAAVAPVEGEAPVPTAGGTPPVGAAPAPQPEEPAGEPAAELKCPSCKEPVQSDWQLCPNCEAPLGAGGP